MRRFKVAEGQQERIRNGRLQKGWRVSEEDIRPLSEASKCLIDRYAQENNWSDDDLRWLENFANIFRVVEQNQNIDHIKRQIRNSPGSLLHNIKQLIDDGEIFAKGISYRTWRSFTSQTPTSRINAPAFQAYCDALGLEWEEIAEIPLAALANPRPIYNNLPTPDYTELVGRETEISELLNFLSQKNIYRVIVEGSGGLGKTALVLEVAYRCLQARLNGDNNFNVPIFDAFIFTSARQQHLTGCGLLRWTQQQSKRIDIISAIADTIEFPEIKSILDPKQQLQQLRVKLSSFHSLLIIDNLETVEDQEDVLALIYELPPTVKVIITSRQQAPLDCYLALEPLSEEACFQLIENLACQGSVVINTNQYQKIYDGTGGIPGAIIYPIGQLRASRSLDGVLQQLHQPKHNIPRFWFESSLQPLQNQPAHYLLMALAMFPQPAMKAAIVQVALPIADDRNIDEELAVLQQLWLIKFQKERYVINLPLTRSYVFGELAANCEFEQAARERWINWYLQYSQEYGQKDEKEWHDYEILEEEWDNLQAVMEWCIDQNRYEEFLQLWRNINCYSHTQGYSRGDRTTAWRNGLDWIDWLIQAAIQHQHWSTVAELMANKGWTLTLIGNNRFTEAQTLFTQAWKLRHHQNSNFQLTLAIHIGCLRIEQQKFPQAHRWFHWSQNLLNRVTLDPEIATRHQIQILYNQGQIHFKTSNYHEAETSYQQALSLAKTIDWQRAMCLIQNWLADIAIELGNLQKSQELLEQCLLVAEKNLDQCTIAFCKQSTAFLAKADGNWTDAQSFAQSAYQDFLKLGMLAEAEETQTLLQVIKSNI
ncbi:tetratricopeptide repeat protein [Nodularia chucula]|uniref:tetratricopeptide repeat protein n=1 Tax=Nodularia chucula TaxID=3093667 RepID=UPI0039C6171C